MLMFIDRVRDMPIAQSLDIFVDLQQVFTAIKNVAVQRRPAARCKTSDIGHESLGVERSAQRAGAAHMSRWANEQVQAIPAAPQVGLYSKRVFELVLLGVIETKDWHGRLNFRNEANRMRKHRVRIAFGCSRCWTTGGNPLPSELGNVRPALAD